MPPPNLLKSFDSAIAQVSRLALSGAVAISGDALATNLDRLATELRDARHSAESLGTVDGPWIRATIRWVAEWVPDDGLPLLASLGAIARAAGRVTNATE